MVFPVTNPSKPDTLRCRCCGGPVTIEHWRDEPTRRHHFMLRHPARRVAKKAAPTISIPAYPFVPVDTVDVPPMARQFAVDDLVLAQHRPGKLGQTINRLVDECMTHFEKECRKVVEGGPQPSPAFEFVNEFLQEPYPVLHTVPEVAHTVPKLQPVAPKPEPQPEPALPGFGFTKRRIAL